MLYFLLFIFEFFLLFFLSKKLVNALAGIIFRLTHSHQAMVHIMAIIFLPGTIIHELAHLLFAGVILVPVGELNVLPVIEEHGVKLGSVQIGKTDPFRRALIGVAPVLLGLICIASIFLFVQIGKANTPWWQVILALYLVFEIGNTMFSSKKDLEGMIIFISSIIVLVIAIIAAFYFLNPTLLQNFWSYLSSLNLEFTINIFKSAGLYLLAPILLDLLVILITKPLVTFNPFP